MEYCNSELKGIIEKTILKQIPECSHFILNKKYHVELLAQWKVLEFSNKSKTKLLNVESLLLHNFKDRSSQHRWMNRRYFSVSWKYIYLLIVNAYYSTCKIFLHEFYTLRIISEVLIALALLNTQYSWIHVLWYGIECKIEYLFLQSIGVPTM